MDQEKVNKLKKEFKHFKYSNRFRIKFNQFGKFDNEFVKVTDRVTEIRFKVIDDNLVYHMESTYEVDFVLSSTFYNEKGFTGSFIDNLYEDLPPLEDFIEELNNCLSINVRLSSNVKQTFNLDLNKKDIINL